jgi:hypothetical protein
MADPYRAAMTCDGYPKDQIEREIESFAVLRELGDQQPTAVVRHMTGATRRISRPTPPRLGWSLSLPRPATRS